MDLQIEHMSSTKVTRLPKLWHVPDVIRFFIGREHELTLLKSQLKQPQAKIKISGTGGIGKSQLALKLIHDSIDEQLFNYAAMLNANTQNHDQLSLEFSDLAQTFDIKIKDNPNVVNDVLCELSNRGPTLLVLDDVTNVDDLQGYLPKSHSNISVIITTRDNRAWADIIQSITLDLFSLSEAVSFLLQATQNDQANAAEAQDLAITLGRFPLALAQAAGYILTSNISLQKYLDLYQEKARSQQRLLEKSPIKGDTHQEAIWITVTLCLEAINNKNAERILQICALLSPELPIENRLFSYWFDSTSISAETIRSLQNFSLLTQTGHQEHVKVHQIVQNIILLLHEDILSFTNCKNVVTYLGEFFELNEGEANNEQRGSKLVPHMSTIIQHLLSLPLTNKIDKDHSVGLMKYYLGTCYAKMYQYERAYSLFNESVRLFLKCGDDNPLIAACYSNLATTAHSLHKIEEALEFSTTALNIQERLLGKNSSELIPTLNCVATIYIDIGFLEPAIEIIDRALSLNVETNSSARADLLCNKANCLSELNRNDEALEIYQQVRTLDEEIYGKKHLKSVTTLLNLAEIMGKVNDVAAQISLLEYCLEIIKQIAPDNHPLFASVLNQLAVAQGEIGDHKTKIALLLQAKKINEHQNNQAELANNLINLGNAYADTRQNYLALSCYKRAVEINQSLFGLQSPKAALAMASYAMSLGDTGNFDACIKTLDEALQIFITCFGQDHPLVEQTKMNIVSANRRKANIQYPGGFFSATFYNDLIGSGEYYSKNNEYH